MGRASRQQQNDPKQSADENHSTRGNCQDYRHQISNIMTLVNEIKTKQVEGTQRTESESAPQIGNYQKRIVRTKQQNGCRNRAVKINYR